ncbi:hypothetical protein MIMGU_mgv1a001115mg [Erythranthe guttata]|uniref:non-specific serine/threonine protein kinase n=1 Tax=Erythranthe guttata TaxID=4155 RepID=A0A022QLF8_ERYGU|nr:hypothetical protein MIMGU_mgv1a001115mg [Erythranthe guttata]
MDLSGKIPPHLGNLSFLVSLDMSGNSFHGNLPHDLAKLKRLRFISLSSNKFGGEIPAWFGELRSLQRLFLDNCSFDGPIPPSLSNMSKLETLSLTYNSINGVIPSEIGGFRSLKILSLRENQLSGSMPAGIFNISTLETVDLTSNELTGEIPSEIGNLPNLEILVLGTNSLTGRIPGTIFNISTLRTLSVRENRLIGNLPSNMGRRLPNLGAIFLGQNNLTGPIPDSISNASMLTRLSLVANKLTGHIPNSLGELTMLDFLNLGENNLTSESFSQMSFITSLTNCRRLRVMWIQNNSFSGYLPDSIGNLSFTLERIDTSNSGIKGSIPRDIGNVSSLAFLYMDNNDLVGPVPATIKGLKNLQALSLIGNKLSGPIPDDICHLLNLGELTLSKNRFYGPVPPCLSNITALKYLNLDSNELNSSISPTIGGLKNLLNFNLFSNFLSGTIPQEIGNLETIISIDLSSNKLSGGIPGTIVGLNNLINLSLAHNRLEGSIPDSVDKMLSLERFDLSHNNLTGLIPKSMVVLQHLEYLNLSFNKLTGEIPTGGPFGHFNYQSFVSNEALCGPPMFQVPPCNHRKLRQKILLVVLIPLSVASAIFATAVSTELFPTVMPERIRYIDLERATSGFDEANLIGIGSFGSVYKGVFPDGNFMAVKVFNLQMDGAFKSFDTECEFLRSLCHHNLTKVISSCSNLEFRALILEYMPNGSLEKWLYSENETLNLLQRLNILIDVASAIDYLHDGYITPVVHCDLKPSNVLLDEDMVAHVSDFGIAKLVNAEDCVVQTRTLATFGYIAPEYGSEGLVSTRCDVYSFGIMVMETFTRKRPTDDLFAEGLSIRDWAREKRGICLTAVMKLALDCSAELPGDRTNMKDALATLLKIKNRFAA